MTAIPGTSPLVPSQATNPQSSQKIVHAARDFEALLLGSLLRSLEQGFSLLPGDEPSSPDSYRDFSAEALASGLAARGGIGIGNMILRTLMKTNPIERDPGPKVFSPSGR